MGMRELSGAVRNGPGLDGIRHHFANRGPSGQSYGFSSSHVWM